MHGITNWRDLPTGLILAICQLERCFQVNKGKAVQQLNIISGITEKSDMLGC
ncbi:hypothetical protein ACFO4N_09120 [Camelliibacillus cellulosilyticus]|uniref:Uncharacterized protein n=1 Tax=Camelliibacillus cellulosilyticus TaxID=2174486 RepID=A0ABV9GPN8_9BACL